MFHLPTRSVHLKIVSRSSETQVITCKAIYVIIQTKTLQNATTTIFTCWIWGSHIGVSEWCCPLNSNSMYERSLQVGGAYRLYSQGRIVNQERNLWNERYTNSTSGLLFLVPCSIPCLTLNKKAMRSADTSGSLLIASSHK
jgi:hypothetical protein